MLATFFAAPDRADAGLVLVPLSASPWRARWRSACRRPGGAPSREPDRGVPVRVFDAMSQAQWMFLVTRKPRVHARDGQRPDVLAAAGHPSGLTVAVMVVYLASPSAWRHRWRCWSVLRRGAQLRHAVRSIGRAGLGGGAARRLHGAIASTSARSRWQRATTRPIAAGAGGGAGGESRRVTLEVVRATPTAAVT
jgi:hypothetical protein